MGDLIQGRDRAWSGRNEPPLVAPGPPFNAPFGGCMGIESFSGMRSKAEVSSEAGAILFTVMPSAANSRANALVRPMAAALNPA